MACSNGNLEKFIEPYRSYPCLWKVKSDEYKNRNLKNRAYDKLIVFCKSAVCSDANKDFVINKIQRIRGSFRKEINKIQGIVGPSIRNLRKSKEYVGSSVRNLRK